jgi:branched-chain amino acid transport system permease protein
VSSQPADSAGPADPESPLEPFATAPGADRRSTRALRAAGVLAFAAFLGIFPQLFTDQATTSIAVYTVIFMAAAVSWNIFSGYSGYLALGHAVFFGSGAYAVAIMANDWHVPGGWAVFALLPLGGLVAALIAIPVGMIALRTRKHTFVVLTIAIFFIFQLVATNATFTGGTSGYIYPFAPFPPYTYNNPFYYVGLAILAVTVAASWGIRRSRFGLQLLAIRDDEDRARGLGVKTWRVKLIAFTVSAFPLGMLGALYFYFIGQVFPQTAFNPLFDLSIALMAFLGGLGTLTGPLLGALLLESMQQYFTQQFSANGTYLIAYGALFLVVILLLPQGLVPSISQLIARRRARVADNARRARETGVKGGVAGAA